MPELPEVEVTYRALKERCIGLRLTNIAVSPRFTNTTSKKGTPKNPLFVDTAGLVAHLTTQSLCIQSIHRMGKWIIIALRNNNYCPYVLFHLGMSGLLYAVKEPHTPHPGIHLYTNTSVHIVFRDARMFGRCVCTCSKNEVANFPTLDALDPHFDINQLKRMLANRHTMIKPWLMDQTNIAGIGNIYANEILWKAGVHPTRRTDTINISECTALHGSIRQVLHEAIRHNGTSLGRGASHFNPRSTNGPTHQDHLQVYGRSGCECSRCGVLIQKVERLGQQPTYFCPQCQKN